MKKVISGALALMMVFSMTFALTGCGGPNPKLKQVDDMLLKYQTVISACEDEFTKFPQADDESYNASLKKIEDSIIQVKDLEVKTKESYNKNRDTYSDEKIDELIKVLGDQIKNAESFKEKIITGVKNANDFLATQQGAAQQGAAQ
ncbi:MAG: hypothetical protein RSC43_03230 [Clostridia bacterium]